jgi:hypothetical protein
LGLATSFLCGAILLRLTSLRIPRPLLLSVSFLANV